ncbi:hypothetical protein JCM11641_002108 [Rhodosporidiobolus odoratus]
MRTLVATGCSSGLGLSALSLFIDRVIQQPSASAARWQIIAGHRTTLSGDADRLTARAAAYTEVIDLIWLPLDLRDTDNVETFARRITDHHSVNRVEILFLNAAVWTNNLRVVDRRKNTWAEEAVVNHFSQDHLIKLLLPLLEKAAASASEHAAIAPRIVYTTSSLHASIASTAEIPALLGPFPLSASPSPSTVPQSTAKQRYVASKLAALMSAQSWKMKFADQEGSAVIDVLAVSPGFVPSTGLSRESSTLGRWVMQNLVSWAPLAVTEEEGARRLLRALPHPASFSAAQPDSADSDLFALLTSSRSPTTPLVYLSGPSTAPLEEVQGKLGGAFMDWLAQEEARGTTDARGKSAEEY